MPITKKEFEDKDFYKKRSSKKQEIVVKFLEENKDKAFTTKEIAMEIYGEEDEKTKLKAHFLLDRLSKKGTVIKKLPYWKIKEEE